MSFQGPSSCSRTCKKGAVRTSEGAGGVCGDARAQTVSAANRWAAARYPSAPGALSTPHHRQTGLRHQDFVRLGNDKLHGHPSFTLTATQDRSRIQAPSKPATCSRWQRRGLICLSTPRRLALSMTSLRRERRNTLTCVSDPSPPSRGRSSRCARVLSGLVSTSRGSVA